LSKGCGGLAANCRSLAARLLHQGSARTAGFRLPSRGVRPARQSRQGVGATAPDAQFAVRARPCFSDARTAGPRNGVLAEVDPGLKTQEATGWVGDRGQQHKDDRKRLLLPLQLGLPVKRELASSSSVLVIARAGRGWSRGAVLM